jgi:hypothetical protein
VLRAAEKINYPNLLVSRLVLYVSLTGEYLDMHRLASLEYEPTSRAIWDNLFFSRPLVPCFYAVKRFALDPSTPWPLFLVPNPLIYKIDSNQNH